MKVFQIPFCKNTAVVMAALPLAAMMVGCGPSAASLAGATSRNTPESPARRGLATRQVVTPAQTRHPQRAAVTHGQRSQPPVAMVSAGRRNYTTTAKRNPRMEMNRKMTTTHQQVRSPGKVEHVGTDTFQQNVLKADVPVLVDFYADWCGPCRMLAPVLDQVARETPNARVVKVNIDNSPQLAAQYGVSSIPTVMVFKGGSVVAQHTGLADRRTLERLLAR
jgi:thioredoxin 1